MDNVAHSLLGLMLSRAGLNRLTARASAIIVLAANAPDIDVFWSIRNTTAYLDEHRAYTHSIVFAPLVALIPLLLVGFWGKERPRWGWAYLLSLIGVGSHLFLDWTNTYGTRLLMPFSNERYRLDITNVFDFWFWGVLLFASVWPLLARLVGGEIGARRDRYPGRGLAIFALLFLSVYDGARLFLHERAVTQLNNRVYEGQAPKQVAAVPGPANPFRWVGVVETDTLFGRQEFSLREDYDPTLMKIYYKPDLNAAASAARQAPPVGALLRFAAFPLWRLTPVSDPENGTRVEICDLRFGAPTDEHFCATALLNNRNQILTSDFRF